MYTQTKETLAALNPDTALQLLKEGHKRFLNNSRANRDLMQQVAQTATGQAPFAVILSCIDSRTSVELIFDQAIGDVFSARIAGNILNEDILGSMEFATKVVGSKLVLVLGHTKCGAIVGACNKVELGNLTQLLHKVQPAIEAASTVPGEHNGANPEFVNKVAALNVELTIERIRNESPIIAELEKEGKVKIVGAMYNVENGEVDFYE